MSDELKPVFTQQGIKALLDVYNLGARVGITHVALGTGDVVNGDGSYTPVSHMTCLKNEVQRATVSGGKFIGSRLNQLHLSATIRDGDNLTMDPYPVNEIGFFLEDGELFAVYVTQTTAIAEKQLGADIALSFDLVLATSSVHGRIRWLSTELRLLWMSEQLGLMQVQSAAQYPFPPKKLGLVT